MVARPSRKVALLALLAAYASALLVALLVGGMLAGQPPLLRSAAADIAATVVIFLLSVLLRNTSLYDPYWSVAPIALVLAWAKLPAGGSDGAARIALVLTLVAVWGLRLTWNFLRRWRGLGDEDWRYSGLRERSRGLFPLVNLFGLQLMPTALVFAALLPVYAVLTAPAAPFGLLDGLALVVTAGAILIEAAADWQLRRFLDGDRAPGAFLATGLWRLSRHPNYFGEIAFWWGLGLFALAADPGNAWTLVGPAAITLLFVFVSVPMMDRRMHARRGYAEHCARTSAIVPRPPRRSG
ncbi:MAG: hypothetical protein CVU56_23270 [Deltaproteobacteria bacterium HGW-Deltaproteobacteria-14]|jgi:steroid 5-alpha reductase family enzyme|nr:MAG: hypothetical protein CVU56_23270 [Deltaproteobacteria bacterium HGW-Deltaproteobacteria-14]